MKRLLAATLFVIALPVTASPFVVSDPVDPATTSCGFTMDATPKQTVAVATAGSSKICKLDLAGLTVGSHTVTATAIVNDPIWGVLESAPSLPLSFVKPAVPASPVNIRLSP